ncbi:MAG TPA: YbjQ family protein [bacterium]
MFDLIVFLTLVLTGYVFGRVNEAAHYRSIRNRERASRRMAVHCAKTVDPAWDVAGARLVTGSTAVSVDYFKRVAAGLRNFFGGRVSAYETLLDRARREAVLRMKEEARRFGAAAIVNVRIDTSSISGAKGGSKIACVEVLASGTAVKLK